MITELHIFDFDGTVVDSSHRYRTQICEDGIERIDLDYWIANECRTLDDKPIEPVASEFRKLVADARHYVIVATARIWCDLSQQMAEENDLIPQKIVARRDRSDTRGGAALKIQGIKPLLNLRQFRNVKRIHVYEDNKKYLQDLCAAFPKHETVPHFFPSNQGH